MVFFWNQHSIRWFLDASAYNGFHQEVALLLRPYLRPSDTLCDVGCGLGRLDLELAPYVNSLTAIDINAQVIAVLQQDVVAYGLANLQAECGDAAALTERFDLVMMSFFGKYGGMEAYYRLCRRKLIRIVNATNEGTLYPSQYRRTVKDTIASVREELTALDRNFELARGVFEFGQPLRSWPEAECFVRHHAPAANIREINTFLRENAKLTGQVDFPYYLPNQKEIGVFVIDAEVY